MTRTRSSESVSASAAMCARACEPAPSTARSLESGRASARVATAVTAAVRIGCQRGAVHHGRQLAGLAVVQEDAALVGVDPVLRRVLGEDADRLERVQGLLAAPVAGHQPEEAG